MFDRVLDTSGMFKERQKLQKTRKGVIFRNASAKLFLRNFWEKLRNDFLHSYFQQVLKEIKKQASEMFYKESYSKKFCNIHRNTPVSESLFNKVVGLQACNFIKRRLQHKCFSVNIGKFLRPPIVKNTCERLLL